MARPTDYKPEFCEMVDKYLEECQDESIEIVKGNSGKSDYTSYDYKLKVKLPTIEGFASYLNVSKRVIYNWEKEHEEFMHALDKIRIEQKERLLNSGLSGDYNSTIAKLILSSNHGMSDKIDQNIGGQKDNPLHISVEMPEE